MKEWHRPTDFETIQNIFDLILNCDPLRMINSMKYPI